MDSGCRHANYYDFSVIITNLNQKYGITDRTDKITIFEKKYDFLLLIGQTPMYLVSLESYLKMQENGACFVLISWKYIDLSEFQWKKNI